MASNSVTNPGVVNISDQGYDSLPVQVPSLGTPTGEAIDITQIGLQGQGKGVATQTPAIGSTIPTNNFLTQAGNEVGTAMGPNVGQNSIIGQNFVVGPVQNVFP